MRAQLLSWFSQEKFYSTLHRARDVDYLLSALGINTVVDLRSREEAAGDLGERLLYQYFLDEEEARKITSRAKCEPVDVYVSRVHIHKRAHKASYHVCHLELLVAFTVKKHHGQYHETSAYTYKNSHPSIISVVHTFSLFPHPLLLLFAGPIAGNVVAGAPCQWDRHVFSQAYSCQHAISTAET